MRSEREPGPGHGGPCRTRSTLGFYFEGGGAIGKLRRMVSDVFQKDQSGYYVENI